MKKEKILEVAEELFAEKGFEGTSVRDIAQKAEVNIAMISYYFGSKEKLLEALIDMHAGYATMQLEELKNNQALQKLGKKVLGPIGGASLGGAIDGVVLQINNMVTKGGRNAGGGIDANVLEYVDSEFGLSYH